MLCPCVFSNFVTSLVCVVLILCIFVFQFYLAIKDYQDIRHEVKAALRNGIPHQDKSIVTEISLRTSDADSLILEVWAVGVLNRFIKNFKLF